KDCLKLCLCSCCLCDGVASSGRMGSGCSVEAARSLDCQSCNSCVENAKLDASHVWSGCVSRDEEAWDALATPHPLMCSRQEEPTPRGPTPPWAVAASEHRIDRTSTGATPPRMLAPTRLSPPGLPEELDQNHNQPALLMALGLNFSREIFRAARLGDVVVLEKLLEDAYQAQNADRHVRNVVEREDIAMLLSLARDCSTGETLLGAAAKHGEAAAVQLLLVNMADPLVCDSRGRMALHRAAEGGDVLTALLVLDRVQSINRYASLTEFVDNAGDTPGTLAAVAGCSALCTALEVFGDMQLDAEQQYFGQLGRQGVYGGLLAPVELATSSPSKQDMRLLHQASVGTCLIGQLWMNIEEGPGLEQVLDEAFAGLQKAEDLLLSTRWTQSRSDASLKALAKTLDLRVRWQRIRLDASKLAETEVEEFWHTHLSAKRMAQLTRAPGSLQQLYLGVLWLYTRESWLPHVLEAIAGALRGCEEDGSYLFASPFPMKELTEALSPLAQLVQAATCFFRCNGVRHEGVTFRPLVVPSTGLQDLIDKYLANKDDSKKANEAWAGSWFALGSGSFPTAFASRWDAGKRLVQTNSNVLLAIQPDLKSPSYPEHMALRGGGDDVIYPAGTLFRLVRLSRTTSSDLEPQACPKGSQMQWPVTVVELMATDPRPEAFLLLEDWNGLDPGQLEALLASWAEEISGVQQERLEHAMSLLVRGGRYEAAGVLRERPFRAEYFFLTTACLKRG
ncbi:unnamed protein product, partial [Effrenium voratum]